MQRMRVKNMIKPRKFKKGDKVAIVSLSSGTLGNPSCQHQLELGIKRLKSFGLEPVFMPNALKGIDYLYKHPKARAQDLKTAFYDDSISGIICAIGGDDTYRLLPFLMEDQEFVNQVKSHPKIFTGFSDTTNNHFMFYSLGITSYYGPNYLSDLAELEEDMLPYTKNAFLSFFTNSNPVEIKSSPIWYDERKDFSLNALGTNRIAHPEINRYEVLRGEGIVSGKLLGGCLESIFDMLTGTRYSEEKVIYEKYQIFPPKENWKDKILFIETSEERPAPTEYKKMINVLKKHGIFEVINGIIVGKPQNEIYYKEYKKILLDSTEEYKLPIIYNVNFGHAYPRTVIPYGLEAKLDLSQKRITILESLFDSFL
jgi:muramoyltetrapeptide carboxypeptidase LdcA involved in peptidoglycan recycling